MKRRERCGSENKYGPYWGRTLAEQKRTIHTCYMAGVNFYIKESDTDSGMLAHYDPLTVDRTDPLILALQDKNKMLRRTIRADG